MASSFRLSFIKHCIEKFHSVALYYNDDLSTPVSWVLQYPSLNMSHLFTLEAHRKKSLEQCVLARMCELLLEDFQIPFAGIVPTNYPSVGCFENLGFVVDPQKTLHYFSLPE